MHSRSQKTLLGYARCGVATAVLGMQMGVAIAQSVESRPGNVPTGARLPLGLGQLFIRTDGDLRSADADDLRSGVRADWRRGFDLGFASKASERGVSIRHGSLRYTHDKAPGFSAHADYTNLQIAEQGAWLGEVRFASAFSEGPYFGALSLRNRFGHDDFAGTAYGIGAVDAGRLADSSLYQMGVGYQDNQLAFGVAIESGSTVSAQGSLAQTSLSINGTMSLGNSTVGIRFSGADLKHLGQDAERVSVVDGAGFALGLRHRFSDRTRAFAWYSSIRDVEFDLQTGRSPINDASGLSHDAFSIGVIHRF